jgi:ATP-dependent Lon protease
MIPLGGVNDGAFLVGHSYTYTGSTWGRIVDTLIKCKYMNPVVFFDELDKVSTTRNGEEIINILIHMTDATQNDSFQDKYFTNIEFDLSRSLIVFSYNNEDNINPILRDRMIKIKTDGYKMSDKVTIAKRHLIPAILTEFGYGCDDVVFGDDILKQIVQKVKDEEGVRNFKRALHDIVSNLNLVKLLSTDDVVTDGIDVTDVTDATDATDTTNASMSSTNTNRAHAHVHAHAIPVTVTETHVKLYVNDSKKDNTSHLAMYS